MKTKIKKIVNTVLRVFAAVLLVSVVAVFIMSKVSDSPVFIFGKTTMWVMTDSMFPTIPARTYILVEKVSADEVKEGDIIAFKSTDPKIYGQINTHRVVKKQGNVFVTKGDNNDIDDGAFSATAENIVGRYVSTLSVMTVMGRIFLSDVGFICTITLFVVIALICYVPDIKEALKNKEKEQSEDEDPVKKEIDKLVEAEMERRRRENLSLSPATPTENSALNEPDGTPESADNVSLSSTTAEDNSLNEPEDVPEGAEKR